jgi:hypothetical protein
MPTKERSIKTELKKATLARLDHAINNAPSHIRSRIHKPSALGPSLCTKYFYKWRGLTFDEHGQPIKPRSVDAIRKENQARHNDKLKIVANLFLNYQGIWGKRGMAKLIAYETGHHADTVRRYMRDFPQGI